MTENLLVYSDMYERTQTIKDLDKTKEILETRVKKTYLLKGIEGIDVPRRNELHILFDVIETDDHLIRKGMPIDTKDFFISRYVFSHLAGFLKIPGRLYDLIDTFWDLPDLRRIECIEHLGQIIKHFFEHRLEQQETEGSRLKDIYITVFDDIWGEFPRVIHSGIYYPYPDSKALNMLMKGLETVNEQNADREYTFQSAELSPYQSKFNFTNYKSQTTVAQGETIESGIAVINSECKKASFNFQNYILRLQCANGMTSRVKDVDLRVKHYESGFLQKIQNAFVKSLRLEDKFASKYIKAIEYNEEISNDWADLLDIPSSILALSNAEKTELIQIGRNKYGKFTPYNVLNTITDKSTHGTHNDSEKERFNDKALKILDNIEILSLWNPQEIEA